MNAWIKRNSTIVTITAIVLLAAFMRFFQLTSLPPGLHPDEAANGLDIFRILEHHDFQPFYSTNGGREALFFYLQSIGVMIFGNTILGLRVAPALIGTLAVLATFLWARSWFGRRVGILAALLMAVTPWAVTISRDGFRAGMVALMVPLSLWLATKAYRTKSYLYAALTGASIAAGLYTYIAFRLFPLAIIAILGFIFLFRRKSLTGWWGRLGVLAVTFAVILLPMGWYTAMHFDDVFGRSGGVSFLNPDLNHGNPVKTMGDTIVKTALMFNFSGDENYRQNLGGQPELNIFVGVMFILGLLFCAMRIKRLPEFGLLAVWGVMLLPEILTAEGIPHALRAIGALPPTLVFAALGIDFMLRQWQSVFPLNSVARKSGTVAIGILLALTVYQGYVQYFVAWASAPETRDAYAEDSVALANYYNDSPSSAKRYAVAGGYQMNPVEFLTHNHATYTRLDASKVDAVPLDPKQAKEFAVFEGDKEAVLKRLHLKFPKGQTSPHYSSFSGDELFVIYSVPAS